MISAGREANMFAPNPWSREAMTGVCKPGALCQNPGFGSAPISLPHLSTLVTNPPPTLTLTLTP